MAQTVSKEEVARPVSTLTKDARSLVIERLAIEEDILRRRADLASIHARLVQNGIINSLPMCW